MVTLLNRTPVFEGSKAQFAIMMDTKKKLCKDGLDHVLII